MSIVPLILGLSLSVSACPVQDDVLTAAADRIQDDYLSLVDGAVIATEVRRWRDTGRYHALCERDQDFARRLQRDLAVYDGHFVVEATGAGEDSDDWLAAWRASALPANAGVREVRVLEGNVGYLRFSSFYSWDLARPKLESAFALLSDTTGLILDLRQNGGGDDETANHLLRTLLPDTVISVGWTETRQARTDQVLPARTLSASASTVPLVVLIDRRTGSAAEAVAYGLQSQGRATVVGDRSGGAAHMLGDPRPLPHGFSIGVPEARPIDRITGGNWEQSGVAPDRRGGDDPLFVARQVIEAARGRSAAP